MNAARNSFGEKTVGASMQPVKLSLVIGEKGSGVSTLLRAFGERADMQDTLILDSPIKGLAEPWNPDQVAAWLRLNHGDAGHIVLASADLRAPRHLLQALAADADLGQTYRLNALTGVASAWTWQEAAGRVCAGGDGADEASEGADILVEPQLRRLLTIADRIILTHTDRARPEAVTRMAKSLKTLNPPAPILRAHNGDIGPARLVDSGLFDPIDGSVDIDRWLCEAAFGFEAARRGGPNRTQTALSRPNSAAGVHYFAITIDQPLGPHWR